MTQHARHEHPTLAGPRLELPRFQFRPLADDGDETPRTSAPRPMPHIAPAQHAPAWRALATVTPAPAPAPAPAPVPTPVSTLTRTAPPSAHAWSETWSPPARRSALQSLTATHIGVLLIVAMVALVVTSGPAAMKTPPQRLPALVDARSGTAVLPARAAEPATVIDAAPPQRERMLKVGSARLDPNVHAGGIPSPAAAANLAVTGGGRVDAAATSAVQMAGIPSPAAAEQLGPAALPFQPSDGVTLPRSIGERDSHAVDSHYGGGTLPMEEPALPAMTPGAAAERAEQQVIRNELSGGDARSVATDGTYVVSL